MLPLLAAAAFAAVASSSATDQASETCAGGAVGGEERFLIAWPCDPGECHIYFSQQRKALPTNVNIAKATNRTLVLAPFTFYDGQAQEFTNSFKRRAEGRRPLFHAFSDLHDLDGLRAAAAAGGVRILELREWLAGGRKLHVDLAVMSKGIPSQAVREGRADPAQDPRPFVPYECQLEEGGIAYNLTHPVGSGELWGRPSDLVEVGQLVCGYAMLSRAYKDAGLDLEALGEVLEGEHMFARKRAVVLLGVGHQLHSHVPDSWGHGVMAALRFAPSLVSEAERFIRESIAPLVPAGAHPGPLGFPRFVSIHWRHGDYVDYNLLTPPDEVVSRATEQLQAIGCDACPIFLATNCKDEAVLDELVAACAGPLIRYIPQDGPAGEAFRLEGAHLAVDQLVAARATRFVRSGRSAVSVFVERERALLGLGEVVSF